MTQPPPLRRRQWSVLLGFFSAAVGVVPILGLSILGVKLAQSQAGLTLDGLLFYYKGNPEAFMPPKTWAGLLETQVPHTLAYGGLVFLVRHFLELDGSGRNWTRGHAMGIVLGAVNIAGGFLVLAWGSPWHYVKWVAMVSFAGWIEWELGRMAWRAWARTY